MFCNVDNIKKLLQIQSYEYIWPLDTKARIISGKIDTVKINKKDGYEVAFFIANLMNKNGLNRVGHVHIFEHLIHSSSLKFITSQEKLESKIYEILLKNNLLC